MYILGKGGFAVSLARWFKHSNTSFKGFISLDSDMPMLFSIDGSVKPFDYVSDAEFILGTSNTAWRIRFLKHLSEYYPISTSYFPNIVLTDTVFYTDIGVGNLIMPYSTLENRSSLKNFNLINLYSSISYETVLGNNNTIDISANILQRTSIGNNNFIGSKACVTQNLRIGSDNTIDIGECLFDDMRDKEVFRSGVITNKK